MPMIPSTSHEAERQRLREYLLGKMPEDVAAELDTRLFEDNALLDELEQERQLLIEDFVGSGLTAEEAALFQSQLSRSPELRRKADEFRELLEALQRQTPVLENRRTSMLSRILLLLTPAFAVLLCAVSLLYFKERHRNADLHAQLQAGQLTTQAVQPSVAGGQSLVTAFLSANVPRESSAPPVVVLPAKTSTLELQIELHDPPSDVADWKVEVLAGKEILWQSAHTHVHRVGGETFLTLFLNAEDLPPGQYVVRHSPASNPSASQTRLFVIREGR
jgi:hypothetical protein